jgi:hypothetical protein
MNGEMGGGFSGFPRLRGARVLVDMRTATFRTWCVAAGEDAHTLPSRDAPKGRLAR